MPTYTQPEGVSVHAGFPNPLEDKTLQNLDLNRLLIHFALSTFVMRIEGTSWTQLGIFHDDIVLVDRALPIRPDDLVVWTEGADFVISHTSEVPDEQEVWGVVTTAIHPYRKKDIN